MPSRASTLVNYVGLDKSLIGYVFEIAGSLKIGKCITTIIFSWHIADELAPKLKAEGFRGQLIARSPIPRVL